MRTTVLIDDALIEEAKELSGLEKTSQVIDVALKDYVRRQNRIRLALLFGSYEDEAIEAPPRRKQ